jgi:hypothetical protein
LEIYLLELAAPDTDKAFLFPKLALRSTGGRNGLSMTFSRIMARAKIVGEVLRAPQQGGKGRKVRTLLFIPSDTALIQRWQTREFPRK